MPLTGSQFAFTLTAMPALLEVKGVVVGVVGVVRLSEVEEPVADVVGPGRSSRWPCATKPVRKKLRY